MNIIIPIGGKGERFSKCGYTKPKPLIPILNKPMILHVLDHLRLSCQDKIFIIYYNIDPDVFEVPILDKYPTVCFISLSKQTSGAAETIYLGLQEILSLSKGCDVCRKTMLLDCDAFYGQDVVSMFSMIDPCKNAVFYTKNTDLNPIFSYIVMDDLGQISQIEEKQKISDNANTGIYCFSDIEILYQYAKQIVDLGIVVRGECYTSCIIAEMLKDGRIFMGIELNPACVFNVGTPLQLETYIRDTFVFLFDLDGTLVITEDIYYEIWKELLETYKITLTKEVFTTIISGNNDAHVFSRLLPNISLAHREMISMKKDEVFSSHIDKIRMVDGAMEFLDGIYRHGHKMAIITNCNRATAELILSYLNMNQFFDTVIIGSECLRAKPYPDPYVQGIRFFGVTSDRVIIFEDSKTGILSAQGVSGRSVIGIQTLYSAKELLDIGVDRAIENYVDLSYRDILDYHNMNINTMKRHIINSMGGWNIMDIHVNEEKLKGGFISDVIALDIIRCIEETGATETIHCVLKLESKNDTFLSKMSNDLALYQREYYFYENVSKFVPLKIPEFYGLVYDEKFENIGILMKNLAYDGRFDLNLDLNKVSLDVALRVISSMAKMHAKFWGLDLQKNFPDLKKHNDPLFYPSWGEFVLNRWPIFLDNWSYLLTEEQISIVKDIVLRFDEIQANMSDQNLTLCHGDIKSANIFYEKCQNGSYEPYFIDWQYTIIGKGVQDLVFFMIESFNIDVIRKYRSVFTEYYYLKLIEYGVKDYSWTDFERDFKTATCYFPLFVAIWFGTVNHDELIDKNFPTFFIQKFFAFILHN